VSATKVPPRRRRRLPIARVRDGARAGGDYGASERPDWRELEWPAVIHDTEAGGYRLRHVDLGSGSGPPVVLIHGLAGCWQNWLENVAVIAEHRRVIAVDLPGFGLSEPAPPACSITALAQAVEALCEQLETGPVVLVGNSMGGQTAAELALIEPGRVAQLVLVGAAGISTCDLPANRFRMLVRMLAAAGTTAPMASRGFIRRPRSRHLAFGAIWRHPTRIRLDLLGEISDGTGAPGFRAAMDAILEHDYRQRLPEIEAPTLVVHGDDDGLVPVRDAEEFARLIPDSRLLVFEDTAHMPMLERPAPFNRALLDFIGETEAGESVSAPAETSSELAAAETG
jgi:pimeloyl-ACP methyl ester carboxylesterase